LTWETSGSSSVRRSGSWAPTPHCGSGQLRRRAPDGESGAEFVRRHRREIVSRIAYWTGESTITVRAFVDFLIQRSASLELHVRGLEASTLIELTAFGTAVMMNYRLTDALHGNSSGDDA